MSDTIEKDASENFFVKKDDINEGDVTLNENSLIPLIVVKEEPTIVEIELAEEQEEQESPIKQKRKYIRKPKPEVVTDAEPKPKRKYVRKSKIDLPIKDPDTNNKDLSVSAVSEELLNASINVDTSAELNSSTPSLNNIIVAESKPKGKKSWPRRKKDDKSKLSENNSTTTEDLISIVTQDNSTVENSIKKPELELGTLENSIPKVKSKGRRNKFTDEAFIADANENEDLPSSVKIEPTEGQSDMDSIHNPVPTAVIKCDMSTNAPKLEGWKPKRPVPTTRRTKLLTFSEMPERPLDDTERKAINNKNKRKSREEKKDIEELEPGEVRVYSELPETAVAGKRPVNNRNKRKPKDEKTEKETQELESPTEEMDVKEENKIDETCTTAADSVHLNSDMSEIDGNDMELHFMDNEGPEEFVPMNPAVEKNVMTAIDDVAKGEGEISPNLVSFPRRISTRTRTARRSYISPTHTPIPRRTSKRKSQEFVNLINIEANERVPTFQDTATDSFSAPIVEDIEHAEENNHSDEECEDELPVVYNAETCSICRWKIRPDPESENVPRRKNHRYTYSMDEKHELYADGEFLMDEYEIEKNREDQVLWRIIDSCKCVQRFDPYEVNGRVFHHGTDHYHVFAEKDWEFYQRFQPVYAVLILENDDYQMAIFVSVDRLLPCLALLSRTEDLYDSYKVIIQMMISANLERNFIHNQLRGENGDIYFSSNWEKIASVIDCRVKEIWNAEHWAQGVFNILTNFPRLIYSRIVSEEKIHCTTCRNRDRKAVFNIKCLGSPYNQETFEPLPAPSIPTCQICYYCQPLIKSFSRLFHHRFLLFGCIQKNISLILSELGENEKCDPLQLLQNMLDDHEWILNMFLEFQVVLAEADRSISQIVTDPNKPAKARNIRKPKK